MQWFEYDIKTICLGKVAKKSLFFCQTLRGGVTPNQTLFFKKKVFQGPHRTILGHPKHVLHLIPSPNAIAKALNVM